VLSLAYLDVNLHDYFIDASIQPITETLWRQAFHGLWALRLVEFNIFRTPALVTIFDI
jgi:hypothetical protein